MRPLLTLLLLTLASVSWAAETPDRGGWFKSLKQNVTGASCCDISDCRQTQAKWLPSKPPAQAGMSSPPKGNSTEWQWWADVQGEWMPIPPEKVLKKTSIDGDAYVCAGYDRRIYCFVPPNLDY